MVDYQVIVIGGGILGVSVATELARQGIRRVLVLEQGRYGGGATGLAGAMVRRIHRSVELSELASEGAAGHATAVQNEPRLLERHGLLFLPDSRPHPTLRLPSADVLTMSADQLAQAYPGIRLPSTQHGYFDAAAYGVDPVLVTQAWLALAWKLGVASMEGVRVDGLVHASGGVVRGVNTTQGRLSARVVVVAAGAWTPRLLAREGLTSPVRTKAIAVHFFGLRDSSKLPMLVDEGTGLYGRPLQRRWYLAGLPTHDWDLDPDTRLQASAQHASCTARYVRDLLPALDTERYGGGRCGLDAYTATGVPHVAFSPEIANLLIVSGGSGAGFMCAPALARHAACLLRSASVLEEEIDAFRSSGARTADVS